MTNGKSNSKLVSALAEELVKELKNKDAFNLSENEDFQFFTDLLYDALDKKTDAEEKLGESADDITENLNETSDRLGDLSNKIDEVRKNNNENAELLSMKDDDIVESVKGLEATVNGLTQKDKGDSKYIIPKDDIDEIKAVGRNTRSELEDINDRSAIILEHVVKNSKKHLKKIERAEKKNESSIRRSRRKTNRKHKLQIGHATNSIKRTIKARFSKWWSRIKKLMLVASLFIFGPVIKKLIGAIVDKTQPLWQPVVDWFKEEFPQMTDFIKSIAESVGTIMDFIKPFVDYFAAEEDEEVTAKEATEMAQGTVVADENGNLIKVRELTDEEAAAMAQARTENEEPATLIAEPADAVKTGIASGINPLAGLAVGLAAKGKDEENKARAANEGSFNVFNDDIARLEALREQTDDPVRQAELDAQILQLEANKVKLENQIVEQNGNFVNGIANWLSGNGKRRRAKRLAAAQQAANDAQTAYTNMVSSQGGGQTAVGAGAPETSAVAGNSYIETVTYDIRNEIKREEDGLQE